MELSSYNKLHSHYLNKISVLKMCEYLSYSDKHTRQHSFINSFREIYLKIEIRNSKNQFYFLQYFLFFIKRINLNIINEDNNIGKRKSINKESFDLMDFSKQKPLLNGKSVRILYFRYI